MTRIFPWILTGALALLASAAGAGDALTADQIIDRNVAARGGLEAWRKIQTMGWTGRIESGPGGISKIPFLMLFRRPDAMRFEILQEGQRAVRVFDGGKGWKLIPVAGSIPELKDYTAEEISFARDAAGLDGPLFDSKSKGVSIALQGMDIVEGHSAFRLKVTLPSGQVHDEWIDAQSYLELRYDRATRNAAGMSAVVSVYYRNYQTINGLLIPLLIETGGTASKDTDKMIIEKIALNPTIEASQFAKPTSLPTRRKGVLVNTQSAGAASKP